MKKFVAVIVKDEQGRVLMIHTRKCIDGSKTINRDVWEFPGGKLDENERDEETAARELYEETGLVCYVFARIGTEIEHVNGQEWEGHFYLAGKFTGEPRIMEPHKSVELKFLSLEEIRKLPNAPPGTVRMAARVQEKS